MSAAVDNAPAQLDAAQVRRALAAFEDMPGQVSVMYLQDVGARPTYAQYPTTAASLDEAARNVAQVDLMDEPLGIYVRGTTVAEGVAWRGTSDDTVAWIAFRADLDLAKPGGPATWPDLFAVFNTANLPTPTYWQHSGGGFYPTWQLAEPVAHGPEPVAVAADIEAELRRAWNTAGYTAGVDSCRDAARVWRLAGSVHRKNRACPITSTIGHVSAEVFTLDELRARVPVQVAKPGFDGNRSAPRIATAEDFERTWERSLEAVVARGRDNFRHSFFVAARNAHRMEAIGLRSRESISAALLELVRVYWPNAQFDGDDIQHIRDALNNPLERGDNAGALASPWQLKVEEQAEPVVELDAEAAAAEEARKFESVVAYELRKRAIRRAADEAERPSAEPISAGVLRWSDIATVKPPRMRVRKLVAESAVTWLSGRSGSYKSFLGVAIGMSIATGKNVCGHDEWSVSEPLTVLYVAAEGPAGVSIRAQAYAKHHGLHDDVLEKRFILYPKRVDLRAESGRAAVRAFAESENVGMVIYDTWHKVTPGLDDSSRQEVGEVMSFFDSLRDELGVESLVVDHTGHAGERATGSSSKIDDADCSLIVKMPGRERTADVQRTLVVDKLKDAETAGMWDLHLLAVPSVLDDEGQSARVLAVGPIPFADAFLVSKEPDWRFVDVPADVRDYQGTGKDGLNVVARIVMNHGRGEAGISRAEALRYYRGAVEGLTADASAARVARAWDALHALQRLESVSPTGSSKITHHKWVEKIIN